LLSTLLDSILRWIFSFPLTSATYQTFHQRLFWSLGCLAADVRRQENSAVASLPASPWLERRHVTSAIETLSEAVHPGFSGERAQQLDNAVSRNLPMFYKRAFRCLGNRPDAEDAVQDALLSACKHFGQFRGQAQLSTWLTAIVTNAARMQLRRRRRVNYVSLEEQKGEDGLTFSEKLPDSKPSPEEVCSVSEARDRVLDGIGQLSPTLRRAFQLRDIDGLSTKEAALVLGVPQGTLKARLARARAKLAGIMQKRPNEQIALTSYESPTRRIADDAPDVPKK
jgi:RNA polymerase sigma-70 factor, ECF subfamily